MQLLGQGGQMYSGSADDAQALHDLVAGQQRAGVDAAELAHALLAFLLLLQKFALT